MLWQGHSFEKKTIKENGHEQEVVICMTEDEYNDRSYREYLELSAEERTKEQLRSKNHPERDPKKLEILAALMKERTKYRERKKSEHPKKLF